MSHPYADLPDRQFWRRAVSQVEAHRVDPVHAPRFRLRSGERVVTAGSCFAQHIARRLVEVGHGFHVVERGEHLAEDARRRHGYGVFSARFGNIYTTVQLLQLFQEALGLRTPAEAALPRADRRWADPWRQQVEPEGFASPEALNEDRALHLAAVRRMMEEADVFVFTLGLTEAWRSREDGSVYSAAPGVAAGVFDPSRHEFVNFGVDETQAALDGALALLRGVNPGVRAVLTVSPVPLVATYEPRHVLTSTTYSKAVLRVAAEAALRRYEWVDYFPSFEIITGPHAGGLYYEDDLREVNRLGVAHAMRVFVRHYLEAAGDADALDRASEAAGRRQVEAGLPSAVPGPAADIVCDEEALDALRI